MRANGFKPFIVSASGIEFMRVFAEGVFGIPPEQVIGSSNKTALETRDGRPVLMKLAELRSFDDREEKVVNIHMHIGRHAILAFGNSDGDGAMMRYALSGTGPASRCCYITMMPSGEFAYDREYHLSPLARLSTMLELWLHCCEH